MRILVVGSSRTPETDSQTLKTVGRELGRELGRQGHTVIVGSDDATDIDPYVVEGVLGGQSGNVEVHVPRGEPEPYDRKPKNRRREVVWHTFRDWDVTINEVIKKVDGVIAVGGKLGVIQASLAG